MRKKSVLTLRPERSFHFTGYLVSESSALYAVAQPNRTAAVLLHTLKLKRRHAVLHRQSIEYALHSAAAVNARANENADLIEKSRCKEARVNVSAADDCRSLHVKLAGENFAGAV